MRDFGQVRKHNRPAPHQIEKQKTIGMPDKRDAHPVEDARK
jgi:hypothetical protein